MLLTALGIGLLAAYYFGVQAGIWAAAATAGLLIAALVPALKIYAYVALVVGVGALAYLGPKLRRPNSAARWIGAGKTIARKYTDGLFASKDQAARKRR